ncbi:hypothetical protein TVAG_219570 [Trichomonas vaginalis G3]|uniref:ABC transmembrane type-1 domain-containing protein n=1 Tax=Trichomonas vaginalis (strain ATCC PRA-98 / G3) TaxID=412133 RepID=A2DXR6_TRIV3|nr:ATPase activity, coupled to transmembrane movement of substances [Trichomonas vaginalis G3]EAY14776.1 hypothetical protein TVAG_219570 [Trichomonas vaginalis G3]KAI5508050.1 ATPase activity, coupled to transmembrane movement of substances [Trichomonas vaginalis G3]|eukprot:XP_001326999.1 hypothetical protein [Trichomonas vaginalis G3]
MEEAQTQDQNNVEMHEIESPPPQPQVPAMITDEEKKMSKGILGMLMFQSKGSLLAMIPCVLIGAAPLVAFLLFGRILNLISKYYMEIQQNQTPKDVMHDIGMNCIYICIVSVLSGILKYLQTFTYIRIGANMSKNIKSSLFKSIACSDITRSFRRMDKVYQVANVREFLLPEQFLNLRQSRFATKQHQLLM